MICSLVARKSKFNVGRSLTGFDSDDPVDFGLVKYRLATSETW